MNHVSISMPLALFVYNFDRVVSTVHFRNLLSIVNVVAKVAVVRREM